MITQTNKNIVYAFCDYLDLCKLKCALDLRNKNSKTVRELNSLEDKPFHIGIIEADKELLESLRKQGEFDLGEISFTKIQEKKYPLIRLNNDYEKILLVPKNITHFIEEKDYYKIPIPESNKHCLLSDFFHEFCANNYLHNHPLFYGTPKVIDSEGNFQIQQTES